MQGIQILQPGVFIVVSNKLHHWKNPMESAVFSGWQRTVFPCTHMCRAALAGSRCSGQGGATFPPDSRQGVNVESVTHPHTALFPGFSEWSLLELKGCSWGGRCKFTRGYSAPDSLHKSTNKTEQTFLTFFSPFQAMNFWTWLLWVPIWRYSRRLQNLHCADLHRP